MTEKPPFIQALVLNAVRRYVAESIRSGSHLSASDCAVEILQTYPSCTMTEIELADEIVIAGARAGVAVEIGRSRRPRGHSSAAGPRKVA